MEKLDLKTYDVKNKVVVIADADITEKEMSSLSGKLKKAGALEVMFSFGGVDITLLSDEDLRLVGLCRIAIAPKKKKKGKILDGTSH